MIKLTANQRKKIIDSLPANFFDSYKNADKYKQMELIKTLTDFLEYSSNRNDSRAFLLEQFNLDIGTFDI